MRQNSKFTHETADKKLIKRELIRLELSLQDAINKYGGNKEIIVFMHYPPVTADSVCRELIDVLKEEKINLVYHGHIHGTGLNNAVKQYDGIEFKLISCDCIDFCPFLIV